MAKLPNQAPPLPPRHPPGRPPAGTSEAAERDALGLSVESSEALALTPLTPTGLEWEETHPLAGPLPAMANPDERWQPTEDQLRGIASYAVAGLANRDIGRYFGQPAEKISRQMRSERIKPYIEGARAKADRVLEFDALRAEGMRPKALDAVERIIDNPAHRENGSTARWLIEKTMGKKWTPALADNSINIAVSLNSRLNSAIEEAALGFARVARHIPRERVADIAHLVRGSDAEHDIPEGVSDGDLDRMGATSTD